MNLLRISFGSFIAASVILVGGCGSDTPENDDGVADDGGLPDQGDPPTCESELPFPSCGGDPIRVDERVDAHPAGDTFGTVASVSTDSGTFEVTVDGTEPSVFRLPADPGLAVGDPLDVLHEPLGWRLESDGRVVAFVGVVARELTHGAWPTDDAMGPAFETIAGVDVSVSPSCGFWGQLVSCGVTIPDEAVAVYDIGVGGLTTVSIGGTQTLALDDGRQLTVANDGVFQGVWGHRRPCDEDTCLLPRPVGFRVTLVFGPGCTPPDEVMVGCEPLPAGSTEPGCSGSAFGSPVPGGDEDTLWPIGCEVTYPCCLEAFPSFVASCECAEFAAPTWNCPQ